MREDEKVTDEMVEAGAVALYDATRGEEYADSYWDWPYIDGVYDWDGRMRARVAILDVSVLHRGGSVMTTHRTSSLLGPSYGATGQSVPPAVPARPPEVLLVGARMQKWVDGEALPTTTLLAKWVHDLYAVVDGAEPLGEYGPSPVAALDGEAGR